ncbi:MAG: alpha/beta fold hydrolase [Myxococcales bacterium]|nr:alpha/beta fold hydrolase [Myxococcales bacterium]
MTTESTTPPHASSSDRAAGSPVVVDPPRFVASTDGHELQLRAIRPAEAGEGEAILCVHGLFSDSRSFLGGGDQGPARFLAERGHTVYLGELRGHGRSRGPAPRGGGWGFDAYARADIPALIRAVHLEEGRPIYLFCHSMAGYAALAGLALDPELQGMVAGVALLSSAVNDYSDGGLKKVAMIKLGAVLGAVLGRFPAKALKMGPSDEPGRLMQQFAEWARDRSFRSEDGSVDYWEALAEVRVPVFAGIGEADLFHASPARGKRLVERLGGENKTFVVLGRSSGLSRDFGHVDVLRGRSAEAEVLPQIDAWIHGVAGR